MARYPGLTLRVLGKRAAALGPGKAELIARISETGSISAAARAMGMSYRRAWQLAVFALGLHRTFGARLLWFLLAIAYYAVLNGSEAGQTFGKRLLGIAVRDAATGASIGVQRAVLRYVVVGLFRVVLFFGLFTLLDGLWPLWDAQRQALHDKIAGSVVVRVTPS